MSDNRSSPNVVPAAPKAVPATPGRTSPDRAPCSCPRRARLKAAVKADPHRRHRLVSQPRPSCSRWPPTRTLARGRWSSWLKARLYVLRADGSIPGELPVDRARVNAAGGLVSQTSVVAARRPRRCRSLATATSARNVRWWSDDADEEWDEGLDVAVETEDSPSSAYAAAARRRARAARCCRVLPRRRLVTQIIARGAGARAAALADLYGSSGSAPPSPARLAQRAQQGLHRLVLDARRLHARAGRLRLRPSAWCDPHAASLLLHFFFDVARVEPRRVHLALAALQMRHVDARRGELAQTARRWGWEQASNRIRPAGTP